MTDPKGENTDASARQTRETKPRPDAMKTTELQLAFGGEIDPGVVEKPINIDMDNPMETLPLLVQLLCQQEHAFSAGLTDGQIMAIDDLLLPSGVKYAKLMTGDGATAMIGFAELRRLAVLRDDNTIHDLADRALVSSIFTNPRRDIVQHALDRVHQICRVAFKSRGESQRLLRYASGSANARLLIKFALSASMEAGDRYWASFRRSDSSRDFLDRLKPAVYDLHTQLAYCRAVQNSETNIAESEFDDIDMDSDMESASANGVSIPDPDGEDRSLYGIMAKRRAAMFAEKASVPQRPLAGPSGKSEQIAVPEGHLVVVGKLATGTREREWQSDQLRKASGRPMPLVETPDLKQVRAGLVAKHPHFADIIDAILKPLVPHRYVHLQPTLLLGNPGCGKSTFAADLGAALGLPTIAFDAGGMSDSMILGCSRKWGNGSAGIHLQTILDHGIANPLLIADELEKAGGNDRNGDIRAQLLGLLEPRTAATYVDRFLETPCDFSGINWLFTANEIEPISRPLRSRLRILRCSDPNAEHLPILAGTLLKAEYALRGLDERWIEPLTGLELNAIAEHWANNIRNLKRLIAAVLQARENYRESICS